MRLSTDADRDEGAASETIAAAAEAGITIFDTARSYGRGEGESATTSAAGPRIARLRRGRRREDRHEGRMARTGGAWARRPRQEDPRRLRGEPRRPRRPGDRPLPRARTRSAHAVGASVRALARLVDDGLVGRIGVANVNRRQLDEALDLARSRPSRSL
jgi:aryl-alcohol dehydrogenase-like predicted oxidoreductase